MKTKPVIFLHIPKTAGSSFIKSLAEVYGNRFLPLTYGLPWPNLDDIDISDYRAFAGHITTGHQIFDELKSYTSITILRDPVARTIDAYNYFMECEEHPLHKEMAFTSFTHALTDAPEEWGLRNAMVRYLSGLSEEEEPDGQKRLAQAKAALKKFAIIGFTERYRFFLAECNRLLGWDAVERRENVGSYAPKYREEVVNLVRGENQLDIELYQYAREQRGEPMWRKPPLPYGWYLTQGPPYAVVHVTEIYDVHEGERFYGPIQLEELLD